MVSSGDRSEIAFFDVETTVPTRPGQGFGILEFGSILVCPRKLVELQSYSTLVRPTDPSLISTLSVRCNGITKEAVISAPTFSEIADRVYDILHGRIWAGHNILRFDCARIRDAFAEINRPVPEPKGTIDSLALLTQKFGRRAGDMKMASLATYFGLGRQTHRSLDDVRMNLEVLKHCATVLFLESSLPDIFTANSWVSPNATTRSRSHGKASPDGTSPSTKTPSSSRIENHPILSLMTPNTGEVLDLVESSTARPDPFDMGPLGSSMEMELIQSAVTLKDEPKIESPEPCSRTASEGSSGCNVFLELDEISLPSITVVLAPFYHGTQKIQVLHKNTVLQLCCSCLKVRFGVSNKFLDYAGRPRLSFVVEAPPNLCQVLEECDGLVQKLSMDSGCSSEWRSVVIRKAGFWNSPTIRFHLPSVSDGNITSWTTEVYRKESSTTQTQRLVFSRFDVAELDEVIVPGTFVDVHFSLNPYDYQQNAGIRLVAKKLIINSN